MQENFEIVLIEGQNQKIGDTANIFNKRHPKSQVSHTTVD